MSYTYKYPRPALTVDALVFAGNRQDGFSLLLIRRKNEPYKNQWAIPGGFVDMDETLEEAVLRELEEETGIRLDKMEQLHAFSAIERDPRHRTVSVAFTGIIVARQQATGGDDAAEAKWFSTDRLPELAFDHQEIIDLAIKKLKLNVQKQ